MGGCLLFGGTSRQLTKLKTLLGLAVSRVAVLRNHRQSRCTQAQADVAHLILLGHQDRALLRAEMVIKERNMLDVLAMVETYCHLLTDRAFLLHKQKECPEELKEAAAGLAFVASRCGDMPELREIRRIFSSRFGKEFSTAAAELRNNCGVSGKIVQKFSTRQPSLESRIQVTKEIAKEKGIKVEIIEPSPESREHQKTQHSPDTPPLPQNDACDFHQLLGTKAQEMNHKDVGSAAQAAYESAAYAAVAARTAVELYRSESRNRAKRVDDSQSVIKLLKEIESNSPSNSSCSSRSKAGSFGAETEKRRGKGIRSEDGEIEIEELKEEDGSSKAIVELKKAWNFAGFTDLNDEASRRQALERERNSPAEAKESPEEETMETSFGRRNSVSARTRR